METLPQIDFIDCEASPPLRRHVESGIATLEDRFGRITACRVVVRGPGSRHHTGGLYEIAIHLSLPDGRLVNIKRAPPEDERLSRPIFAIDDAFKRARRALQDQTRRIQGKIKAHEGQPLGTVRNLSKDGFGFIDSDDGREIYFHANSVLNGGFTELKPGDRVMFAEEVGDKGPQASTVRLLGKHSLRL